MPTATQIAVQALRRRTFAVISHPDAGKSTLTEALALFTGNWHIGMLKRDNPDSQLDPLVAAAD